MTQFEARKSELFGWALYLGHVHFSVDRYGKCYSYGGGLVPEMEWCRRHYSFGDIVLMRDQICNTFTSKRGTGYGSKFSDRRGLFLKHMATFLNDRLAVELKELA